MNCSIHPEQLLQGLCTLPSCQYEPRYCRECFSDWHENHREYGVALAQFDQVKILIWDKMIQSVENELNQFMHLYQQMRKNFSSKVWLLESRVISAIIRKQNKFDALMQKIISNITSLKDIVEMCNDHIEALQTMQEVELCVIKGNQFYSNLHHQEALIAYEEAAQVDPECAVAHMIRGFQLKKAKQYQQALEEFRVALLLDSDLINCYNEIGLILMKVDKHSEALECFELAIKFNPRNAQFLYNRGNALMQLSQLEQAVESFDLAINLNEHNAVYFNNKGCALYELERYHQALQAYERASQLNPTQASYYFNQGVILDCLKKFDRAAEKYELAIQKKPDERQYYIRKANALSENGNLQMALHTLDRVLSLDPNDDYALDLKGSCLRKAKRYAEAVDCYEAALKINPKQPTYHNNKGIALQLLGKHEEAMREYELARKLTLEIEFLTYEQVSETSIQSPSYNVSNVDAVNPFEKDRSVDFNLSQGHQKAEDSQNQLETTSSAQRDLEIVAAYYDQAIALNNQDTLLHNNRGIILAKLAKYEEAAVEFESAIKLDPNQPLYYSNRGYALQLLGRKDEALEMYGLAIQAYFQENKKKMRSCQPVAVNKSGQIFQFINDSANIDKSACESIALGKFPKIEADHRQLGSIDRQSED